MTYLNLTVTHLIGCYQLVSFAERSHFVFSYLLDVQVVFHPALANGSLLKHVIFSFEDAATEDKIMHYNTVYAYIWRAITRLVQQVVCPKHAKNNSEHSEQSPIVPKPPAKKVRSNDPTMTLLQCIMPGQASANQQRGSMTPHEQAEDEIATVFK